MANTNAKTLHFRRIVNEPLKTFLLDLLTHPRQRDPTCSPMFQNIAQKGATTVLN